VDSVWPPRIRNVGPRSLITRACQGFLERVAFPLQFEFLFSFPGKMLDPQVFAPATSGDFAAPDAVKKDRAGPSTRGVAERTLAQTSFKDWLATYW
jgi:hypothetical protein